MSTIAAPGLGAESNDPLLWAILCYAASRRTSIAQAALNLEAAPSANTIREHLRGRLPVSVAERRQLELRLKQTLQAQIPPRVLKRLRRSRVEVAGDLTDIPYHGEPEQNEAEVRCSQAKSGTTRFHSYASLQIVHHRQRLTIAVTFVSKGETMDLVVKRLLQAARRFGVRIKRAYFDKGFASNSQRPEFFSVKIDEIAEEVRKNHGEIEITKIAEAKEYRQSTTMAKSNIISPAREPVSEVQPATHPDNSSLPRPMSSPATITHTTPALS